MLSVEEIRKKIFDQAAMFKHHYERKEYARAKAAYTTARTVAVFVELPEPDMIELFGSRSYTDTVPPTDGLFYESQVQKAFLECIKKNEGLYENMNFEKCKKNSA